VTRPCGWTRENTKVLWTLIDYFLRSSSKQYFSYIQDENNSINKKNDTEMKKEWSNRGNDFECHWKSVKSCVGTNIIVFCRVYFCIVCKHTKEIFNVQRVWHSPNTLLTMVPGEGHREGTPILHVETHWAVLLVEPVSRHQYHASQEQYETIMY